MVNQSVINESDVPDFEVVKDIHLPTFAPDEFPLLDPSNADHSPRIKDETWSSYESQSESANGATQLRHDPNLLDKMI